ncbi:hypothetical protein HOY82DRAFT_562604 [Tuber indicum]|nr:hypothetical protein HOY82DRAFT_562604 [Tuber indicum]
MALTRGRYLVLIVLCSGVPMKIGEHNPCLYRDLYGIGRNSLPILTDTPVHMSLIHIRPPAEDSPAEHWGALNKY